MEHWQRSATQCSAEGYKVASFLQDICHREDPTRPVTCGMDQVSCVLENGFAAMIDVPGLNYRAHRYVESYNALPQNIILGSETASTVSSRGVYKFPVEKRAGATYADHQSSGYDVEYCSWSNVPMRTLPWPMITTGLSGSLSGRVLTIWANPLRTTRMPGPATVPYSASLTW